MTPVQRAEHYWQPHPEMKAAFPDYTRRHHYSDEMLEYPHIQVLVQDRLDKEDNRKKKMWEKANVRQTPCACGCGETLPNANSTYIIGHHLRK